MFFKSAKTLNELVMHLGNQKYEEISIIIVNAEKPQKMPQTNPFLVEDFVKKSINRHEQTENMKYTRQFTTKDPVCSVKLLTLEEFMGINVVTDIIWENVCARFLIFNIPTSTPWRNWLWKSRIKMTAL
ncbi:hypothetical protein AVEN_109047-1 [Araneus ventricosus]|uniref:Uncharacterized protein n=1 Tax=Araneus ventricosus TaxID=182803 RepID=A0A4Y2UTC5_ARAVE|nr:hypothetical protein AVEN_109047-1 [Araneus ventricosus]